MTSPELLCLACGGKKEETRLRSRLCRKCDYERKEAGRAHAIICPTCAQPMTKATAKRVMERG